MLNIFRRKSQRGDKESGGSGDEGSAKGSGSDSEDESSSEEEVLWIFVVCYIITAFLILTFVNFTVWKAQGCFWSDSSQKSKQGCEKSCKT